LKEVKGEEYFTFNRIAVMKKWLANHRPVPKEGQRGYRRTDAVKTPDRACGMLFVVKPESEEEKKG
jgi:hypothetical protein